MAIVEIVTVGITTETVEEEEEVDTEAIIIIKKITKLLTRTGGMVPGITLEIKITKLSLIKPRLISTLRTTTAVEEDPQVTTPTRTTPTRATPTRTTVIRLTKPQIRLTTTTRPTRTTTYGKIRIRRRDSSAIHRGLWTTRTLSLRTKPQATTVKV